MTGVARTGISVPQGIFSRDIGVAVVGANGGIGHALVQALAEIPRVTHQWAVTRRPVIDLPKNADNPLLDITDETSIAAAADGVACSGRSLDLVIVTAGILHGDGLAPEKSSRDMSHANFERVFAANAFGPAMVAKHFLPLLPRDRRAIFAAISARVGSISDNRAGGWYAYRASKSALNMILRSLAIEWRRKASEGVCVGLHPGTVATNLSAPFGKGIPADKIFSPDQAAGYLLNVIANLAPNDSGQVFAWDGSRIEP